MGGASDIRAGGATIEISANDAKLAQSLRSVQGKMDKFAGQVGKLGTKLVGVGAAMLAPIGAGLKTAMDFQEQMAMVSTMLSEMDMEIFPKLTEGVQRLSVELGESTATLSKGLYDILSASIAPAKALEVLGVASKAAAAGMTDTGISADAITTILNSFRLSADKAGSVADLLFAIVKRGKTTFAELAPSIGMVASTASAAGLPLEEMGALLSTMTRNGVKTQVAVTALNSILSTFLKPTDEAAKTAKKFGFELNTTTLRTEGFIGVLRKLAQAGATAEDIAKMFPNVRALRGVIPALQDLAGITADYNQMVNRVGATQEAFNKISKTMAYQVRQLKQEFTDLLVAIGTQLLPMVLDLTKDAKGLVVSLKSWVKENKTLVVGFTKLGIAITSIGATLIIFAGAAKAASFAMVLLQKSMILSGVKGLVKSMAEAVFHMKAMRAATRLNNVAFQKYGNMMILKSGEAVTALKTWKSAATSAKIGIVALGAAVAVLGYEVGRTIDNWTGLSDKLADFFSDPRWKDVGKLTPEEAKANQKRQEGYNKIAKAARLSRKELTEVFKILERSKDVRTEGIGLSLKDITATDNFVNLLDNIRKNSDIVIGKYGDMTKAVRAWLNESNKAAKAASAAPQAAAKAAGKLFEFTDEIKTAFKDAGNLQSELQKIYEDVQKADLSKPQREAAEFEEKIKKLRMAAAGWAGIEIKKLHEEFGKKIPQKAYDEIIKVQRQANELVEKWADLQAKAFREERAAKMRDRIQSIKDELQDLNNSQIQQNGTLKERLALIDAETKKRMKGGSFAEQVQTVLLGSRKKELLIQQEQLGFMDKFRAELDGLNQEAVKRTKTLEDDLALLKKQEKAALKTGKEIGLSEEDLATIKEVFALKRKNIQIGVEADKTVADAFGTFSINAARMLAPTQEELVDINKGMAATLGAIEKNTREMGGLA